MADYPDAINSPRTKANRSGVVFDADKETVIFAEDLQNCDDEIVAIETELGTNPRGVYATVKAWLTALALAISNHLADFANPHAVTKTQVGLSNVTNDAQLPLSGGTMSGSIVTANNNIYGGAGPINDDSVMIITPARGIGFIIIAPRLNAYNTLSGIIMYRTASPSMSVILVQGGTLIETSTAVLNGTTGTDGKFTVSANIDGNIYLENRLNALRSISWTLFGA